MIKQYIDQLQKKVNIPHPPKRIISLVPSQTELLFYLGLQDTPNSQIGWGNLSVFDWSKWSDITVSQTHKNISKTQIKWESKQDKDCQGRQDKENRFGQVKKA